jgi:hypothetical protein
MLLGYLVSEGPETKWDCDRCETDEAEMAQKACRNCNGETPEAWCLYFDWGPELTECPRSYFSDEEWYYFYLYSDWKMFRTTPWGNVYDAPGPVYQAIRTIECAAKEHESKALAKQKREVAKGSKGWQKGRR